MTSGHHIRHCNGPVSRRRDCRYRRSAKNAPQATAWGKSGGYRTIHYFGGDDIPVFLLSIYEKGAKADLTARERNKLATILPKLARNYRMG
jgi:hypothetical protein